MPTVGAVTAKQSAETKVENKLQTAGIEDVHAALVMRKCLCEVFSRISLTQKPREMMRQAQVEEHGDQYFRCSVARRKLVNGPVEAKCTWEDFKRIVSRGVPDVCFREKLQWTADQWRTHWSVVIGAFAIRSASGIAKARLDGFDSVAEQTCCVVQVPASETFDAHVV